MSNMNKAKYFEVVSTSIVRANNMTEARRAAQSRTRVPKTEVLARSTDVNRLPAREARTIAGAIDNG